MLKIKNLWVKIGKKEILKGINLQIKEGEIHVLMGPNGAGKSTLAMTIIGGSKFNPLASLRARVKSSEFTMGRINISKLNIEERARKGIFVAFQNPEELDGISVLSFLRAAYNAIYPAKRIPLREFREKVKKALKQVLLNEDFLQRSVNQGFSGGEKKRLEILQMLVLKPKLAVLDEIDSGLDVDNFKKIVSIIKTTAKKQKTGILVITHQSQIFNYLKPDFIHVLKEGKLLKINCLETIERIQKYGYAAV